MDNDIKSSGDDEEQGHGGNGFLRLPYGIAKERGIDTKGLTPSEVWAKLKGVGIDPQAEIDRLKEGTMQRRNMYGDVVDKDAKVATEPTRDKGTVAERDRLNGGTGELSDRLYREGAVKEYSKAELAKFAKVMNTPNAKLMANVILDSVDGVLITNEDIARLTLETQSKLPRKAIAHCERSNYTYAATLKHMSKGSPPSDRLVNYSLYQRGSALTVNYRMPYERRARSIVDHELAHYIDNKFSFEGEHLELVKEYEKIKQWLRDKEQVASSSADNEKYGGGKWNDQQKRIKREIDRDYRWREFPSDKIARNLKLRGITTDQIKAELSEYANKNNKELFAEGYSAIKNIPKEQYTPVMKAFADEFDKVIGGLK